MTTIPGPNDAVFLEKFRRAYKTVSLIGIGMISGLAVYLLLEEIIRSRFRPFIGFFSGSLNAGNRTTLRYAFYAGAVAVVILLRVVNGLLLRKIGGPDPEIDLNRLFRAGIVALSLSEVPAILGLALFLAAGYNRDFYVLLFVSLFLFFMYFPKLRNWEDLIQQRPGSCGR